MLLFHTCRRWCWHHENNRLDAKLAHLAKFDLDSDKNNYRHHRCYLQLNDDLEILDNYESNIERAKKTQNDPNENEHGDDPHKWW